MSTKYYVIRERASENPNIGVVSYVNGEFDIERIKTALEAHFDEEVSDIKIGEFMDYYSYLEISFSLSPRVEREYVVELEQIWLYI